jgi:hypothetical protein
MVLSSLITLVIVPAGAPYSSLLFVLMEICGLEDD